MERHGDATRFGEVLIGTGFVDVDDLNPAYDGDLGEGIINIEAAIEAAIRSVM